MEKRGDKVNSKSFLEDILLWEPKHYNTLVHLGVLEAKTGDYELSIEYLKRAKTLKNNDFKLNYNLANVYIKTGSYDLACSLLEEALKNDENNLKVLQKLMVCYGKTDVSDKLEYICKKILSIDKSNAKAVALLSRALKENNKFMQLEKLLMKIDTKLEKFTNKTNKNDTVMKIKSKLKEKIEEVKNLMFLENMEHEYESDENKEFPTVNIKLENLEDSNVNKYKERYLQDNNDKEALYYIADDYYKVGEFLNRIMITKQL
jgi:tetratricopeptide (TPR) repeat protein